MAGQDRHGRTVRRLAREDAVGGDDAPLVRQVLQAQEFWRLKGLSADVVIVNEHPIGYMDDMQVHLTALLDDGPWRTWQHRPRGAYLLRADRMGHAERVLLGSLSQ
jgi:cyclic beta-1,2-glucan synthetase